MKEGGSHAECVCTEGSMKCVWGPVTNPTGRAWAPGKGTGPRQRGSQSCKSWFGLAVRSQG